MDEVGPLLKAVNALLILISVNHTIYGVFFMIIKKWMQDRVASVKLIHNRSVNTKCCILGSIDDLFLP